MAFNKNELQTLAELLNIGVFNLAGKNAQSVAFIQNRIAQEYQLLGAEEKPNESAGNSAGDSKKPKQN